MVVNCPSFVGGHSSIGANKGVKSRVCLLAKVDDKEYVLWFGCAIDFWRDNGTFFQIGTGYDEPQDFSQEVIDRFKDRFGQDSWYEPWKWYLSPIPPTLIEDPQNVKQLVEYIAEVAGHCSGEEMGT